MVYFYSWGEPTNLRNRRIRTRENRGVAVVPSKCRHATLEKATITDKFPPPYEVLPHTAAYRAVGRKRQNCGPVRPAHSGVTLVHVTNICHLRILDTSCERSTCTNWYEVQTNKWPVARFSPVSITPPMLHIHLHLHLFLQEGQTCEAWEPSNRHCSFGNR